MDSQFFRMEYPMGNSIDELECLKSQLKLAESTNTNVNCWAAKLEMESLTLKKQLRDDFDQLNDHYQTLSQKGLENTKLLKQMNIKLSQAIKKQKAMERRIATLEQSLSNHDNHQTTFWDGMANAVSIKNDIKKMKEFLTLLVPKIVAIDTHLGELVGKCFPSSVKSLTLLPRRSNDST